MSNLITVGVLCSGELGFYCLSSLLNSNIPVFVFTDNKSNEIINLCSKHDIHLFIGNPRSGRATDFLKQVPSVNVIFSINYLFLVEDDIIAKASMFAINFHGSLLPKYRGRTPHVWAIINGEQEVGITAHLMVKECDAGDIVLQERIKVEKDDTGATILEKYKSRYPILINELLERIQKRTIAFIEQDESLATFYGKRTPEDGEINWNWTCEKIFNWIRAQAHPYPGAFTFYNNKKFHIDKVEYLRNSKYEKAANGTIINTEPQLLIQVKDGLIKVVKMRESENIRFINGKKLGRE